MSEKELRSAVTRAVLTELAASGERWVPVAVSNRHCHLSQADLERLFGPGHRLTPLRLLEQPGQFAAEEKVILETPKGQMSLRVVGPVRRESQVELSMTDARQMGLNLPVRLSGDLAESPGCRLRNGDQNLELTRGVIIAARHLHMSAEEAGIYGLTDGQEVSIRTEGQRASIMEHVTVRAGKGHLLEVHIDTDEANASGIRSGQLCRLLVPERAEPAAVLLTGRKTAGWKPVPAAENLWNSSRPPGPDIRVGESLRNSGKETMLDYSGKTDLLLTEELVYRAAGQGMKYIRLAHGTLVTPLARDVAWEKGIELVYPGGTKEQR